MSSQNCRVNYIKNLDFNSFHPKRAGAIIYTLYKNKIQFVLGKDTDSGDATDFAGGIAIKTENGLAGGLRELTEESLGIFGKITAEEIKNCIAVYDADNLIMFIPIHIDITKKYQEFAYRVKLLKDPEVSDLYIINKRQFISLIKGGSINGTVMYDRVRKLLFGTRNKGNFMRYL